MRSRFVIAAAVPLALLLAGCVPESDGADPMPSFSIDPSTPAPSETLPTGAGIEEWAAIVLPDDRPGGQAAALRTVGPIDPASPALLDIAQPEGSWDLLMTCQSTDGSPVLWHLESPTAATDEPTELACPTPNGGTPTTTIVTFDGPGTKLELTASASAVFAVEVRPSSGQLD